jgi:hypothetical protein
MGTEGETDLPKLSAPARRALAGAGWVRLDQFTELNEAGVMGLHGMGPKAMDMLRAASRSMDCRSATTEMGLDQSSSASRALRSVEDRAAGPSTRAAGTDPS